MAFGFTADEVFEIAEQIERNGADFYNRVAGRLEGPERRFFLDLSKMELEHEKIFASMRSLLSTANREGGTFDPDQETGEYLRALSGSTIFDDRAKNAFTKIETMSGTQALASALRAAIDLEEDSVVFYLGMKELVPKTLGKDRVEEILREEMRHISLLGGKLISLKK